MTKNLSSFSHKAAISLALLALLQEMLNSFTVYCRLDPEILAIILFLERLAGIFVMSVIFSYSCLTVQSAQEGSER